MLRIVLASSGPCQPPAPSRSRRSAEGQVGRKIRPDPGAIRPDGRTVPPKGGRSAPTRGRSARFTGASAPILGPSVQEGEPPAHRGGRLTAKGGQSPPGTDRPPQRVKRSPQGADRSRIGANRPRNGVQRPEPLLDESIRSPGMLLIAQERGRIAPGVRACSLTTESLQAGAGPGCPGLANPAFLERRATIHLSTDRNRHEENPHLHRHLGHRWLL